MKQHKRGFKLKCIGMVLPVVLGASTAWADERAELETLRETTVNLIQMLVQQGVFTQEKADLLVQQAQTKARDRVAARKKEEEAVVRVQYVPEAVRKQIADQVREEVVAQAKVERWGDANAVPEWADRLKWGGDIRMGYQADRFSDGNALAALHLGQDISNTTEDRDRIRMRARLRLNARVTPEISAGFRLSTGTLSDPVSTNQTMGQNANKYSFVLDRAFVSAHSDTVLPWLTATAGRMPNPWFSTNLVWDDDLNFEGAALHIDPYAQSSNVWRPFATVGAFPLQDVERSAAVNAKSKWLLGAQVGTEWVPDANKRVKVGMAVYDYRNIAGERNTFGQTTTNYSALESRQKGNTVFNITNPVSATNNVYALASDYRVLNLTGMVDLNLFSPVHVVLSADYVKNIGFSRSKTLARTGVDINPDLTGYLAQVTVGMPDMLLKGDWQLSLAYRRLGADAVVDAFTDSDFHLGGTNNKGFILGAQYALSKDTWLTARWLSSNEIRGLPLSTDVFQLYFNARF
jgi:hypothetical protein